MNAEFQRKARRDKKAFLGDQYKEIEENNRKGKARDRLKKIRDTKGIFHAKMGTIKDRNVKAFDCVWITTNCGKFLIFTDGNTIPPNLPPEKSVCRSRSNS